MSFESFPGVEIWVSLLTLTSLEIVLGIDNIVFISILAGKLPVEQRERLRKVGLTLALGIRIGLLFVISWVVGLTEPLFSVFEHEFSGRDLIMLAGGLFLVGKATQEIYEKLEVQHEEHKRSSGAATFGLILAQVLALDIVFSLDSVITAVGMSGEVWVMISAMVISVVVMLAVSGKISEFVNGHPSLKVLALAFLILIGVTLVVEGLGEHVGKGYIYFAMAFSLVIELVNMRLRSKSKAAPVTLHHRFEDQEVLQG